MIRRDPRLAAARARDLVIVGGGAHGIALALEAARRGLEPLLLERRDFGGATSWNSSRILHGGLRYLQSLDLRRHRRSLRERRWFLRHFPDQARPLASLMPLYGDHLRRPAVFRAALLADRLLGPDRNLGLAGPSRLPRARVLSPAETLDRCPIARRDGLLGGALWYDGFLPEAPRLLIEMLRWATAAGASALNYFEAEALLADGGRVEGIRARDLEEGSVYELVAPVVVNCAGPWAREVAGGFDRDLPELAADWLSFNLLLDRQPPGETAVAASPPGGAQSYFLVPWRDRILAGTGDLAAARAEPDGSVPESAIAAFLEELGRALPELAPRREHVLRVLRGRLPAATRDAAGAAARPVIVDHGDIGGPAGLFSLSNVKLTTARHLAERALRRIRAWQGRRLPPYSQVRRPAAAVWPSAAELDRADDSEAADLGRRLRRLAAEEAVVRLEDLMLRRTDWGFDPGRGAARAPEVARLLESASPPESPGASERRPVPR